MGSYSAKNNGNMYGGKKQVSNIHSFSALACIFCDILVYQFVSRNAEIININANCNDHSRR